MRLPILATTLTILALVLPAGGAHAQGPFEGLPAAPAETQTRTATQIADPGTDDGLDAWQTLLIAGAALALLSGVVMVILRDARRRAPIDPGSDEAAHRPPDAHQTAKAAKSRQRAKSKAAREQRRRNR
jgi:hypothetical protein